MSQCTRESNSGAAMAQTPASPRGTGSDVDLPELEQLRLRERLLRAVAEASAVLARIEDLARVLPEVLRILGEAAGLARVALLEKNRECPGKPGVSDHHITAEWRAPGIAAHQEHGTSVMPSIHGEAVMRRLNVGETLWVGIDDMPPLLQPVLRQQRVQATGYVPLFVDGTYAATLAFDNCTEPDAWTAQLDVLTTAANVIAAALQGRRDAARRGVLLGAVAQAAEVLTGTAHLATALAEAAHVLGEATGVDRVNVFRYNHPAATGFLDAEWARDGVPALSAVDPGPFPFTPYAEVWRPLMGGAVYQSPLGAKTGANRALNEATGTRTDLFVPIFVDGTFWGAINFDDCTAERAWADGEVEVLRAAGAAVAAAVRREAQERAHAEALAGERAQAAEERAAELARASDVLRSINSRLTSETDVSAILRHILIEACSVVGVHEGCLALLDPDGAVRIKFAVDEGQPSSTPRGHAYELGQPIPPAEFPGWERTVALKGQPLLWDLSGEGKLAETAGPWHRESGHTGVLLEALMLGDNPVGIIALPYGDGRGFTPEQLGCLQALGQQAALAVQALRMADGARDLAVGREREVSARLRADELARANRTIKRTVDALATEPKLEQALGHVLTAMSEYLGSDSSALWVLDAGQSRFELSLAYLGGQVVLATPANDRLLESVWTRGRDLSFRHHVIERRPVSYDVADGAVLTEHQRAFMQAHDVQNLLGVPLMIGANVVGSFTLRFRERRTFSPEELELTQAVAHQAALALRLVRLGEMARKAAVLDERTRLARDIHDTLAQGFTAINAHLQAIGEDAPGPALSHIQVARELAIQNLAAARHSVRSLRPLELSGGSLAEALSLLVERARKESAATVSLVVPSRALLSVGEQVEEELFRIAQEALTNCLKHAKASRIEIELQARSPATIQMAVRDDGCGFDIAERSLAPERDIGQGGFGLTSMDERARRIGASLTVISEPSLGTEVTVAWPSVPPRPAGGESGHGDEQR